MSVNLILVRMVGNVRICGVPTDVYVETHTQASTVSDVSQ